MPSAGVPEAGGLGSAEEARRACAGSCALQESSRLDASMLQAHLSAPAGDRPLEVQVQGTPGGGAFSGFASRASRLHRLVLVGLQARTSAAPAVRAAVTAQADTSGAQAARAELLSLRAENARLRSETLEDSGWRLSH